MALLYPVVVPCSVILSLIAGDCFTGPTINSADLNDIGVAQFHQFFRCLLTPITAAAVYLLVFCICSITCFGGALRDKITFFQEGMIRYLPFQKRLLLCRTSWRLHRSCSRSPLMAALGSISGNKAILLLSMMCLSAVLPRTPLKKSIQLSVMLCLQIRPHR
jgi:hypothetical protein